MSDQKLDATSPAMMGAVVARQPKNASGNGIGAYHEPRLSGELPPVIYRSVLGCFAWFLLSAWFAFSATTAVDFELAMATVIFLVIFGLVAIAFHVASRRSNTLQPDYDYVSSARIETATGTLRLADAWLQILIVPASLAIAGTLLALTYRLSV